MRTSCDKIPLLFLLALRTVPDLHFNDRSRVGARPAVTSVLDSEDGNSAGSHKEVRLKIRVLAIASQNYFMTVVLVDFNGYYGSPGLFGSHER